MELFKKSVVVGVSVTPEVGLEVAQIDFATRTVLKYGVRPLGYDVNRRDIADLDLFKETLSGLLEELQIPKGTNIVLNIPTVLFKISDYPAALSEVETSNAIEEDLSDHPLFKENEPIMDAVKLQNANLQFNKIAIVAAQRATIAEIAIAIKDLGYKLLAVDSSVNSAINSLMYLERLNVEENNTWVMLLVNSFSCRILLMNGRDYVDSYEERISIGDVLGDAENYATVVNTVSPILKNLPSKYLCVVSKTDIVSAEVLAGKLAYSAPIIHQEANSFSKETFLNLAPDINAAFAQSLSLDVIGAAIYREFAPYTNAHFNLFNRSLGDIYLLEQPPEINIAGRRFVLSPEFLVKAFLVLAAVVIIPTLIAFAYYSKAVADQKVAVEELDQKIAEISKFLKDNESVSADLFDEGDEIRTGLEHNKGVYSYYTIVGTEIPKKLWLTHLKLGEKTTIEGQADNLESVYGFFRSIKDYNPESAIKLQKLGLASKSKVDITDDNADFDTDSILTSMNADFYEFKISDEPEVSKDQLKNGGANAGLPELETIKESN